jgi:hypothetical protein
MKFTIYIRHFLLKYIFLFCIFSFKLSAQHNNIPLGYNFNSFIDKELNQSNNHTSFKPLIKSSLNINVDSLLSANTLFKKNVLKKNIFNKDWIEIKGEDYEILVSPLFDFSLGYEVNEEKYTYTNTRGFIVKGDMGSKVSFHTSFVENQAVFPNYLDSLIRTSTQDYVIPGQGRGRVYYNTGFDYAKSSGYVSVEASKQIKIQFGHGKHFIGNGYRSLLLSDNSFNYPFLRIQTKFGDFEYTNLYAELQDMKNYLSSENNYDYMGYAKKYMSSHYLSYSINNKFNIGVFESILWKTNHALGANGFDVNYLNPIIFFRPVEFSINSPDNAILGLNYKYLISINSQLYGQVVFDEFTLNQLKSNNGYWANKYGYQIGLKYFNLFKVKNLSVQIEHNLVRPYTYSHWNSSNYGHYNEELAHPIGANFSENIFMLNYRSNRVHIKFKYLNITYGADYLNDTISYGNNIYSDYNDRSSDFGVDMFNGNETNIDYYQINLSYILNPSTNSIIDFSLVNRMLSNEISSYNTLFYSISLKSDLFNYYYDF